MESFTSIADNFDKLAAEDQEQTQENEQQAPETDKKVEETALVEKKNGNGEVVIAGVETHRASLYLAEKYLPEERVQDIATELARIDEIEQTETVEMRRELGTLPKDFSKTETALVTCGVNPSRLTVEEAKGVLDYTRNASEEIIDKKTDLIGESIVRIVNGVHNRRDFSYDPDKQRRFDRLADKYQRYLDGEIDIECGYDKEYYIGRDDDYDDYNFESARDNAGYHGHRRGDYSEGAYRKFLKDNGVKTRYESYFDEYTLDELLEEDLISEDDVFVYGPFTKRDINEDLEIFKTMTWTNSTNFRDKDAVGDLLEETVPAHIDDTESDLTREYVAREVLPNRRPSVKNMLSLVACVGLEYSHTDEKAIEEALGDERSSDLRDNLSWAAYYASRAIGMRLNELREEYGTSRPTSEDFFKELFNRSEALTSTQEKFMKTQQGPYLAKLDNRLFASEALFETVMTVKNNASNIEGLSLPGNIMPNPAKLGAAAAKLAATESMVTGA